MEIGRLDDSLDRDPRFDVDVAKYENESLDSLQAEFATAARDARDDPFWLHGSTEPLMEDTPEGPAQPQERADKLASSPALHPPTANASAYTSAPAAGRTADGAGAGQPAVRSSYESRPERQLDFGPAAAPRSVESAGDLRASSSFFPPPAPALPAASTQPLSFPRPSSSLAVPTVLKAAEEEPPPPAGVASEWGYVNRVLSESGFGTIPASALAAGNWQATPGARIVREVLVEVLGQWERRGRLISDLTAAADNARAGEKRAEREAEEAKRECERLAQEVKKLSREADEAKEGLREAAKLRAEESRKADGAVAQATQKRLLLEQSLRSKERELQRIQERVVADVQKEEKRREAERKAVAEAAGKAAGRPGSVVDRTVAQIVSAYESQKEASLAEIKFLRREVKSLTTELKQRDNAAAAGLARPARRPSGEEDGAEGPDSEASTPFGTPLRPSSRARPAPRPVFSSTPHPGLGRSRPSNLSEVEAEQEVRRVREEAAGQLHTAERKIRELENRCVEAERARDEAAFELETRPTLREVHERQLLLDRLQARAEAAEREVAKFRHTMGLAANDYAEWSLGPGRASGSEDRALSVTPLDAAASADATRDAIRRDREMHRLNLHAVPFHITKQILLELCREFNVREAGDLVPAASRLAKAAQSVPKLERFVREACDAIDAARPFEKLREGGAPQNPEAALAALRRALADVADADRLKEVRSAVAAELAARPGVPPSRAKELEAGPASALATAVRELVQVEKVALTSKTGLLEPPDAAAGKMVAHFMHLFDIRSLEGVFPKMNEIFLLVNQANNVLNVLRGMLGLEPKASFNACLAALRGALDRVSAAQAFAMSAFGDEPDRASSLPAAPRRGRSSYPGSVAGHSTTVVGASTIAEPEPSAARELRRVREALGGASVRPDELASRVERYPPSRAHPCAPAGGRRLVRETERSSERLARVEPVVEYLRGALRAPTVEDIVPAAREALERAAAPSDASFSAASEEVRFRRAPAAAWPSARVAGPSLKAAEAAYRADRDAGLLSPSADTSFASAPAPVPELYAALRRSRPEATRPADADSSSEVSGWQDRDF